MKLESPYMVLMTEFVSGKNGSKSFSGFLKYMNRKDSKEEKLKKEKEEKFRNEGFKTYVNYMDREQALLKKDKLSPLELKELEFIAEEKPKLKEKLDSMRREEPRRTKIKNTGLFDFTSDDLTQEEVAKLRNDFNKAQENGNVMFTDVVSFDTKGLIEAGVYNPYTKELNREPLIEASRVMIREMIQDEKLNPETIFTGAIHYNTDHFHIHLATIEPKLSSRKIMNDGKQRGKRKPKTIERMKKNFSNALYDRTSVYKEMSQLRDSLRLDVKQDFHKKIKRNREIKHQFLRVKATLPEEKKNWNTHHLSDSAKKEMYQFIDLLMEKNEDFPLYKSIAKEENDFKAQVYGKLNENKNSYYENKLYGKDGIYYRLSNSILEEMKKEKPSNAKIKTKDYHYQPRDQTKNEIQYHTNSMLLQFKKMQRLMSNEVKQWKAEQEFEQTNQEIQRIQKAREYGLDL